jgi:hypothetical protein
LTFCRKTGSGSDARYTHIDVDIVIVIDIDIGPSLQVHTCANHAGSDTNEAQKETELTGTKEMKSELTSFGAETFASNDISSNYKCPGPPD